MLVRARVDSIVIEGGKAVGVRIGRTGDEIRAPIVISDAGIYNTYQSLLPEPQQHLSGVKNTLSLVQHGMGAMTIYIGMEGSPSELKLPGLNLWAFSEGNKLDEACEKFFSLSLDEALAPETRIPLLFISFPSIKDSTWESRFPGKTTCEIVTLAKWEWFEQWKGERIKKRGDDYEQVKMAFAKKAWNQLVDIYPQLEGKNDYFEAGSPLTNNYYIAAPAGEIYGIDHNVARFSPAAASALRPETPVPGLLLTGQDVFNGGFVGAMFGGLLCASTALGRNLYIDLIKARAQAKAGSA